LPFGLTGNGRLDHQRGFGITEEGDGEETSISGPFAAARACRVRIASRAPGLDPVDDFVDAEMRPRLGV
jgi:hypothetical protein